jgi:hypothetical protein
MIWWIIAGVVIVVLVALAWRSSGRKPGVIPTKGGKTDSGASAAADAGHQAQRGFPPAPG